MAVGAGGDPGLSDQAFSGCCVQVYVWEALVL